MKTKFLTLLVALIATTALWASNTITYTATSQLSETTNTYGKGLHTNAFNVAISSHTFSNGTGTITFAGEVTTIGKYAFHQCSGLTSITIPNSVTTIGNSAFSGCSGLTSINVDASNTHYASVDGVLFNYAKDTLIQYPIGNARILYTIPNSVTTIGESAFEGCSGLTSITIPNSVTTIGRYAFQECTSLTSVTIPNSVTTIGEYAFRNCSGLISITIPNSVTTIGRYAFEYCSSLTSVTIGNSVTTIGEWAFEDCDGLTSITIPNSVTTIGFGAFSGCSGLKSITWNAKNCNGYNFGSQVETFVFGDSVEVIPASICNGMTKLTSITIPNSVTTIGNNAFSGCSGLTSITIPNSVTTIGEDAFSGCSGLTSITIPNSVTTIENYAFSGCSGLTSITIPNSVTTIGKYAFYDCSGLTSVTIPNSVTTIGNSTFEYCSGLSDIYCYATIPPTCESEDVFYGVSQHCYIHVPAGTVRAYELAVGWSHFLHFFEISEVPVGGTDQVGVEVTNNTAVFSWPVNPTASSYTLVIKKNDEVFCTLTFNSLGQLVGMAFAPARGANNDSSAQSTAYGYSFMVSNLDASSTYDYTFTAKDVSNNVLTTTTGQFKTGGTATDILPLLYEDNSRPFEGRAGEGSSKFIHNGRLLIEHNGILYNAHGARVK